MVERDGTRFFVEARTPPPRLIMTGAVHVAQTLAPMARLAGFDAVVVDPRAAFAAGERFPDARLLPQWPDDALPALGLDRFTAVATLAHDPRIDDLALRLALVSDCFYVGALGSRKTQGKRVERLLAAGIEPAALARLHAPIGLDIGASPGEIAVSILSEIILALRDKTQRREAGRRAPVPAPRGGGGNAVKFERVRVEKAPGAIIAHALRLPGLTLKKGDVVDARVIEALTSAGVAKIVAARLEPGDVGENEAAARLAERLAGPHLRVDTAFTGRCNLYAGRAGVVVVNSRQVERLNDVDKSITLATLAPWRRVAEGDMVATVKIIPFAVDAEIFARAMSALEGAALRVAPFVLRGIGAISTVLPGLKRATIEKTLCNLERRLRPARAWLSATAETAHEVEALARALREMAPRSELMVVFGASAITDRRDVVPAAIEASGGSIEHLGMPVDPGNLLLLGELAGRPVIGAPGCARSIQENGFDFILNRLLAGLRVSSADIRRMGVGGLLMEIASRPRPRERLEPARPTDVAPRAAEDEAPGDRSRTSAIDRVRSSRVIAPP